MGKKTKTITAIPQTTLRRLRNTPSYFFLLWRWTTWVAACIWIVDSLGKDIPTDIGIFFLSVTFIQTLVITLYAPVFQILLPRLPWINWLYPLGRARRRLRPPAEDEDADILTPLVRTRNVYWDSLIYGLDVVMCGLIMYYSAPYWGPQFGDASPFYRYGFSTAYAAAFAYRYKGGLAAALGYDLFILLGAYLPPPGVHPTPTAPDIITLFDAPLAATLAAYLASLLESYTRSKRQIQDNARNQEALVLVGETLVRGASDRHTLLQQSAEQIRKGGHFQRLALELVDTSTAKKVPAQEKQGDFIETSIDGSSFSEESRIILKKVLQTGQIVTSFVPLEGKSSPYHLAGIYIPFVKEGHIQLVIGAESIRQTPFESKQEKFLTIVGAQLMVALENMRLTEQTVELAAVAERSRIAREIHDGVAQLIYMLSLSTETCAAQAHRIVEASEEDTELVSPLAERLDRLVKISKQALWETRHYMLTLKPLITGTSTLTQMLTNQLREFETISGLPVHLYVEGTEDVSTGDKEQAHKNAQVGTAIFRITQEALTNAYKHAEATEIQVYLRYLPAYIEVEIYDNGHGIDNELLQSEKQQRIYSGYGIRGMRERAQELGGTLEIQPDPVGGLHVIARIPK